MLKDLKSETDFLKVFPDPDRVFSPAQLFLALHCMPLATISLSAIDSAWQGSVPLIVPIEPHDGYIGDYTKAFHNEYCKENWLAFRLDESNRLELLAHKRYFLLENTNKQDGEPDYARQWLEKHYAEIKQSYEFSKLRFVKYGGLYRYKRPMHALEKANDQVSPFNILDQLGGNVI